MRRLILSVTIAAALAMAGCASISVSSHIEKDVTFSDFVTYDWGPPDNLPVGDPRLDNNPFFVDRLQGSVEKQLAAKGYVHAVTGSPDLLIHYHANVSQRMDVYAVDNQYGYCYGNCEPQVVDYDLGTLIIDIVDNKTNKVVWRGWAQEAMTGIIDNQQRLEKQVDEGVTKMMRLLPKAGTALP